MLLSNIYQTELGLRDIFGKGHVELGVAEGAACCVFGHGARENRKNLHLSRYSEPNFLFTYDLGRGTGARLQTLHVLPHGCR